MKKLLLMPLCMLASFLLLAKDDDSTKNKMNDEEAAFLKMADSINSAMNYETGVIKLPNGVAELNVPAGFKYLNAEQSRQVVTEIWGNPPNDKVIGIIFPENNGPLTRDSYAFIISYDEMGYVKDEDADDINYDDMLKEFQKEEPEVNAERKKQGYEPIHFVGWAQKPYYDKQNKILHWAKELRFGSDETNTLNYNVRILGRKGVLVLNAVGSMTELSVVNKDISKVLHIAKFTEGNKYSDFDPKVDDVAAWTIGGLVAGKVLAKVGFFALILKFWKLIALGAVALVGVIVKVFKRKKPEDTMAVETVQAPPPADGTNA
jgi:uncharacterized membrane-anchored protein